MSVMQRRLAGRPPSAFTVVEVLAALVVVAVGLLAMAGTSALSLRTAMAAARERRAVQRALTRLAILSAAGCGRAASGALDAPAEGMRERWVVTTPRAGVVMMDEWVEWQGGGRPRSLLLESALLC
jgi:Tfp pilus assembly protein PilV